ncbi:MAG: 16S rRNA (cytosine(1402)-N(4))-methyltransferase, partial [Candidatus Gastranaerophilales bacterium]|nr:16S rRNA (cytosine(1402)-N(4))-methyltransferase [Candidatus Gastranaerophilales bacterium]
MMNNNEFNHVTVMLNETVDGVDVKKGLIYIDATLGGGGHSALIVQKLQGEGRLIGFDVDDVAIEAAKKKLEPFKNVVTICKNSYMQIPEKLPELGIEKISGGIIFDLGASYNQLTSENRGFSFLK